MIEEETMKNLTKPHLCSRILQNVVHQSGEDCSWLLVCPRRGLLLHLVNLLLDLDFNPVVLVQVLLPDVDDHVLVVLHGEPHLAILVPAPEEGFPNTPER